VKHSEAIAVPGGPHGAAGAIDHPLLTD